MKVILLEKGDDFIFPSFLQKYYTVGNTYKVLDKGGEFSCRWQITSDSKRIWFYVNPKYLKEINDYIIF